MRVLSALYLRLFAWLVTARVCHVPSPENAALHFERLRSADNL
jgi:hypothetical protein